MDRPEFSTKSALFSSVYQRDPNYLYHGITTQTILKGMCLGLNVCVCVRVCVSRLQLSLLSSSLYEPRYACHLYTRHKQKYSRGAIITYDVCDKIATQLATANQEGQSMARKLPTESIISKMRSTASRRNCTKKMRSHNGNSIRTCPP